MTLLRIGFNAYLLAATKWGSEALPADSESPSPRYEVLVLARPSEDSAPPPALFTLYRRGPRWTIWIRP